MKKARNPFVSNSRHRISDPPVINVILKKSSTMYRSIGPRTIPSIYSSVLTLSSLSLSPSHPPNAGQKGVRSVHRVRRQNFQACTRARTRTHIGKKKGVQEMAISFHGVVSHAAHVDGPFPNIFQVCMALSTIRYFNIDTLSVFTGRRERLGEQSVHICTSFTLGDCTLGTPPADRLAKWSDRDGRTTLTGLARSRFR